MENRSSENKGNNLDAYWDSLRRRSHDDSFPAAAEWIREMHETVGISRLKKSKSRKRSRWLVIASVAFCFILSCTIPVNRVEESGSLVDFSIDKKEGNSFYQLSSLQQRLAFSCYEFLLPDQPAVTFFIFFVPYKEQEKLLSITRELGLLTGLRNLGISSVDYTIRESLFSTFLHKNLKLGKRPKPKREQLTRNIQETLKKKGLGFLSITVSDDNDGTVTFNSDRQNSDSLTTADKDSSTIEIKNYPRDTINRSTVRLNKLQIFNWLLASWKVKYVPQPTYHQWLRMNDSLLICFIVKYPDEELIKIGDNGPDVSVGFSISWSHADSATLSLRGIQWKFLSGNDQEIRFKNETTPKSANVKWSINNDKKTWQSVISGEKNLEIVNLVREQKVGIETIVNEFIAKNPDLVKKARD